MNPQIKAAISSYLRAAVACVGTLYLSGITDPEVLANAFLAALLAPVMKALTPSEKEFGIKKK